MIAENMFWEVWRNVTSATNNWSLGGNNGTSTGPTSKSTQRTRYNRLRSGPTKSISQPANLTALVGLSSSAESLAELKEAGEGEDDSIPKEDLKVEGCKKSSRKISNRQHTSQGSSSFMKHSISSFFPFTSCTSSSAKTTAGAHSSSQEAGLPGKSSSVARIMENEQQSSSSSSSPLGSNNNNRGSGILSSMFSSTGGSRNAGGIYHSPETTAPTPPENSNWDQELEKEVVENNVVQAAAVCEEDEISDLDSEVEQLTCDVCERCFPTLKMLAAHQRKKRHYGCLQCDSIFPSREVLEYHREQMCHYDYAIPYYDEEENEEFPESEDDENRIKDENCDDEERERLL